MISAKMPSSLTVGPPTLRVKDLQKQSSFYNDVLGLEVNRSYRTEDGLAIIELGFNGRLKQRQNTLLVLKHDPNAKEAPHNFAGLYHFAILVPDRKSLAYAYSAVENSRAHFDGFADHLVSESLYLHDPERNGIEIYRDKPRGQWGYDGEGHVLMDTLPLDLDSVLAELSRDERTHAEAFPNGARIGHIHLRVTDLESSVNFYHQKLGLDITADWSGMGAMFLSAGGYHHHIGLNIWHSARGKPHVDGEAGLDVFVVTVPDGSYVEILERELGKHSYSGVGNGELLISDPDGIRILIKSH